MGNRTSPPRAQTDAVDDAALIVRFLAAHKRHCMIRQDKDTICLIVCDSFGFNEWRYESVVKDGAPVLDDESRSVLRERIERARAREGAP